MHSYFQDIEQHVIKQIQLSKSRLLVGVAWFTNEKIGNEITKKKGLDIEIVVDDNKINRECRNLINLQLEGFDISFVKDLNKNYYLMHNKFCVIDNRLVITGSYNWTQNANSNDENITILTDPTNAALYSHEFRRIKTIEFPNGDIFISTEKANEITDFIYNNLVTLLKENIANLQKGLFFRWTNESVKNKLRVVEEELRNTIIEKVGHFGLYNKLIAKYGFQYNSLASEIEKAEARDNFRKQGLDETDFYNNKEFQFFKLKAIKKLQDNYAKLLDTNATDQDAVLKIFKVFQFITREKMDIANDIGVTSI
jgi:hypothetical protein